MSITLRHAGSSPRPLAALAFMGALVFGFTAAPLRGQSSTGRPSPTFDVGLGLATVVTQDLDNVAIGDNGGLAGVAAAGWVPEAGQGRWALAATLLGHFVPDDVAWTATAMVKVRL